MRGCSLAVWARGGALIWAALLATGCGLSATGGASTPQLSVVASGAHCPTPPERPGAYLLDHQLSGGRHVRLGMGRRSTGGYAVELVSKVPERVDDGIAVVRVEWTVPGAGDAVTQALTRPCVEVRVPAAYAGVRFIDGDDIERGEAVWRE